MSLGERRPATTKRAPETRAYVRTYGWRHPRCERSSRLRQASDCSSRSFLFVTIVRHTLTGCHYMIGHPCLKLPPSTYRHRAGVCRQGEETAYVCCPRCPLAAATRNGKSWVPPRRAPVMVLPEVLRGQLRSPCAPAVASLLMLLLC